MEGGRGGRVEEAERVESGKVEGWNGGRVEGWKGGRELWQSGKYQKGRWWESEKRLIPIENASKLQVFGGRN